VPVTTTNQAANQTKGFFLDLLLLLKIAGQTKRRQKDGVRKTKTNGGAKKFAANCF